MPTNHKTESELRWYLRGGAMSTAPAAGVGVRERAREHSIQKRSVAAVPNAVDGSGVTEVRLQVLLVVPVRVLG